MSDYDNVEERILVNGDVIPNHVLVTIMNNISPDSNVGIIFNEFLPMNLRINHMISACTPITLKITIMNKLTSVSRCIECVTFNIKVVRTVNVYGRLHESTLNIISTKNSSKQFTDDYFIEYTFNNELLNRNSSGARREKIQYVDGDICGNHSIYIKNEYGYEMEVNRTYSCGVLKQITTCVFTESGYGREKVCYDTYFNHDNKIDGDQMYLKPIQ